MDRDEQKDLNQYLTFRLNSERFAIDVGQVREILDMTDMTRVPQTPDYMLGVINLRGNVVPVIDLRQRFGLPAAEQTRDSCIIVMEINIDGEQVVIGALADAVEEVLDMRTDDIEAAPRLGAQVNVDFIRGVGKRGEQFVMILEIDRIFATQEAELFRSVQKDDEDVA
ncbi:MAG: chemotaxis protein CheW [Desulfuromonadales bacterium]|nr:chemotaxis protein CheW [Desulfuromonadales bacterium]NIR33686.1 chemotaxis protein CheW [Desulfuromonadales bacterium]NIS44008.1 chemotaxis protein CheW [Desulfuromonadales bacterium]